MSNVKMRRGEKNHNINIRINIRRVLRGQTVAPLSNSDATMDKKLCMN